LVFEIELIEQLEVNIDYILSLVEIYHKSNCENKEILTSITKAISSSPHLRKKKDLIESFVATINSKSKVNEDWIAFVQKKKEEELNKIIADEKLKVEETKKFMDNSLRDGVLKEGGTDIDKLMPKVSLFAKGANNRSAKKKTVLQKLKEFFEKFLGLA
jgi:type I restriction enzyme R subunit